MTPALLRGSSPASSDELGRSGYTRADHVRATHVLLNEGTDAANPAGQLLLDRVATEGSVSIGDLVDLLRHTYDVDVDTAEQDVAALVAAAQDAALVSFSSSAPRRLRYGLLKPARELPWTLWGGPAALTGGPRRQLQPPTLGNLAWWSLLTHLWRSLLVTAGVAALGLGSGALGLTAGSAAFVVQFLLVCLLVMTLSAVAHEGAHLMVARRVGAHRISLFVGGLRLGVTRTHVGNARDLAISVAGPAAGLIVVALLWLGLGWVFGGPLASVSPTAQASARGALAVSAVMNIACVIPPSSDGRAAWSAVRELVRRPA